jgi:spore coat protein A
MPITRRDFLRNSAWTGAALLAQATYPMMPVVQSRGALNTRLLKRFVDPLKIPTVPRPDGYRVNAAGRKIPYHRIEMRQFESRLHRDLKPTIQWGYAASVPGPTLEVRVGEGALVEWVNSLPSKHFLPIDNRLHGAEANQPEVRTVVHVHGGKTPPESDGYPDDWYVPGKSVVFHYPANQDAAMLWYHDHAMGINRLNIFAGLLGVFLVRDEVEEALNLPSGKYEIPLVIYDRTFDENGQLDYPVSGIANAPWVPEFRGNTVLVNGKIFPYLEVEPHKYRFRILNGANTSAFTLSLSTGQPLFQIGTDLGLLPAPVELKALNLFPAERADIIVDFSTYAGKEVVLRQGVVDLMQFRVANGGAADRSAIPAKLRAVPRLVESEAARTRTLTLKDYYDYAGVSTMMLLNGTRWSMPITEKPVINTVEIWSLVNLTTDVHPIHLHLVRFQILDRRPFDKFIYNKDEQIHYTGPAVPPHPNEAGWKDTARAETGMVTRIIARFEGYTGRYVWHCHILEHEDNEMMRPYEVVASSRLAAIESEVPREWCVEGKLTSK